MDENQPVIIDLKTQEVTKTASMVKRDMIKYWTPDYINQRLEQIVKPSHKMLIKFLWMTGVRISEAINLTKKDIDLPNQTLTVKWLKNRKYKYRNVPMHQQLRYILEVYTATMLADDRVFPITRQAAWYLTRKYLNGHPHQLRHSYAIHWLRSGGELVTLHRALGHSKIQTTMEYLKIVPVDQAKELNKINFN